MAPAQEASPLAQGDRVRVKYLEKLEGKDKGHKRTVTAAFVELNDTALTVVGETGLSLVVPREDLLQFDLSTQRSNRGKAAVVGLLSGALVGFLLGASSSCEEDEGCWDLAPPPALVAGLGGGVGALVGVAVGHGEKWQAVPIEGQRVSLHRTHQRSPMVAFTLRF